MNFWERLTYKEEVDNSNEIRLPNGIVYSEKPSLFGKKPKGIVIVFKDEKGKGDKNGK